MNQRTLYCGQIHRTGDGVPVAHACRVLDPDYLHAERTQDYGRAAALLEQMPLVLHGGVHVAEQPGRAAPAAAGP
jgi:hypothetical protein